MGKVKTLSLIGIFLLAIYLRLQGTLGGWFAFTYDQGRDLLDVSHMVYAKDLRLIGPTSGIEGVFHGVWWYYFIAPFLWLFQGNPVLIVAGFNVISALIVFIAYKIGRELISARYGLILALITAISPFFVSTGAQLWNPNVVPLLTLLLLLSLIKYLKREWPFMSQAVFLGAIFVFAVGSGGIFLLAYILTLVIFKIIPKKKDLLSSIVGFGFWLIPAAIFELRHNFLQTRSLIKYIKQPASEVSPFWTRLADRIGTVGHMFTDAFARGNRIVSFVLILLMLLGFTRILDWKKDALIDKFFRLVLILSAILVCIAGLYPKALWDYYLINFIPLIIPLIGWVFYLLIVRYKKLGVLTLAGWLLFMLWPTLTSQSATWKGDASVYRNQMEVIQAIYKKAKGEPFNVAVFSPSLIDYNYQYLFGWYGRKKYDYVPDRENVLPLAFFIIEPDQWNKGLREIWIREREGDGVVVNKQAFESGIVLEMRERGKK